jgi:hypothetical protein
MENATQNTFAQQTWIWTRFALQMYCGLHFQFRRAYYHLVIIPCIIILHRSLQIAAFKKSHYA